MAVRKITDDGRVKLLDGSSLRAELVINATGCSAPALTPGLRVRPRKGHLVITDRYPGFVHHQLIELGYLKSAMPRTVNRSPLTFSRERPARC